MPVLRRVILKGSRKATADSPPLMRFPSPGGADATYNHPRTARCLRLGEGSRGWIVGITPWPFRGRTGAACANPRLVFGFSLLAMTEPARPHSTMSLTCCPSTWWASSTTGAGDGEEAGGKQEDGIGPRGCSICSRFVVRTSTAFPPYCLERKPARHILLGQWHSAATEGDMMSRYVTAVDACGGGMTEPGGSARVLIHKRRDRRMLAGW